MMAVMFAGMERPPPVSFNYLAKRDASYVSYKCAFLCMLGREVYDPKPAKLETPAFVV